MTHRGRLRPARGARWRATVLALMVASAAACENRTPAKEAPAGPQTMSWHQLASWTGRGSRQTESFTSETGMLRLRWQTAGEVPGRTGTFRATLHSAISGRPLAVAVEHNGAGSDTAYVSETPRMFFLVIASDDLDWSVAVDEGAAGTPVEDRKPAA